MAEEEGDLLAGLPRSRPGVRSGKRASAGQRSTPRTQPQPKARRQPAPPPESSSGPADEALRLATGAAGAVLGTASSLTRGILRRLPKP